MAAGAPPPAAAAATISAKQRLNDSDSSAGGTKTLTMPIAARTLEAAASAPTDRHGLLVCGIDTIGRPDCSEAIEKLPTSNWCGWRLIALPAAPSSRPASPISEAAAKPLSVATMPTAPSLEAARTERRGSSTVRAMGRAVGAPPSAACGGAGDAGDGDGAPLVVLLVCGAAAASTSTRLSSFLRASAIRRRISSCGLGL